MTGPELKMVKAVQFQLGEEVISTYPTKEKWSEIRADVLYQLQCKYGIEQETARGLWERMRSES